MSLQLVENPQSRWRQILSEPARLRPGHFVQFYDTPAFLSHTVTEFACAGLERGEGVLIIAQSEHQDLFIKEMNQEFPSLASAFESGRLVLRNARELLLKIMPHDVLDRALLDREVGADVSRMNAQFSGVRIYGEMVDLLLEEGNAAAIRELEKVWCELTKTERVSLLCSYAHTGFADVSQSRLFHEICFDHEHVLPDERFIEACEVDDQNRVIAQLQHRSRILERELQRREDAESIEVARRKFLEVELKRMTQSRDELSKLLNDMRVASQGPAADPEHS